MKRFAFVVICVLVALLCACEGENPAPEAGGQEMVSRLDVPVEFHGIWQGDETVKNEILTISAFDIESAGLGSLVELVNELDEQNRMIAEQNGLYYWSRFNDSSPYDGVYILGFMYTIHTSAVHMEFKFDLQDNGKSIKMTLTYSGLEGMPEGYPPSGTSAIYSKVEV